MSPGTTRKIAEINGMPELVIKLDALGVRVGAEIKKISQFFKTGPIVVESKRSQIALGPKIASNIIVEN
jgi:Fe2+ transport system protein FeoA